MSLIWTARSKADLDRIWLFLVERDLALADRIDRAIRARTEKLVDYPKIGREIASGIREWSMPDIRYVVTYGIEGGHVRVLRVHHARENRRGP